MLQELKAMLGVLTKAAPALYAIYKREQKNEKIVELQESVFLIRDLIITADELLSIVKDKKELNFSVLPRAELTKHYDEVQTKLTIQFQRMQRLGDIYLDNPTIDLLNADLKQEFKEALGDKERGLFSLGAGLFFNLILGFGAERDQNETEDEYFKRITKEKVDFAASIVDFDSFSLEEQRNIVGELKRLQQSYIEALDKVMDANDRLMLAETAEKNAARWGLRN
jgi:hypothetical protein